MQTAIAHDHNDLTDISILYVEDEESIREKYARGLKRICKELYLAKNAEDGLRLYHKHRPDIVISDICVSCVDGVSMLKVIKTCNPDANLIVITAYTDRKHMLEALEMQVNGYLQKPVQNARLKEKVENIAKHICKTRKREAEHAELERQKEILQNVLDHDKNLLVVTDFQKAFFANKAFLELFQAQNVVDFNLMCPDISDIFLPVEGYLHRGLLHDEEIFYDLVMRSEETERMVSIINVKTEPRAYHVNISPITHMAKISYLISLTDITKMNSQKLSTEKKAYIDVLTGIYNRYKFEELFKLEQNRVDRYGVQSSLVVLDIDHFKRFNDSYGHLIGDKVLQLLAKTISENIRKTDIFARWGGEEFILLLPETPLDAACRLVEKLRCKIMQIEFGNAKQITASFGLTQMLSAENLKEAFKRADNALYEAKAAGRNCVKCMVESSKMSVLTCCV